MCPARRIRTMPSAYALGNLNTARLTALADAWRRDGYASFRALCRRTFGRLTSPARSLPIVNWYEAVAVEATGA